ncbi:MAG: ABC transporter ATP-binding protein [Olsenella uli]|uniref:ATP-binding cassette domain-containing protein n=1 Tax=Olsenella uli TaxID=133926 RepID=UPI001DE34124|nr:ATP-binding cassette domain-containing protein [Olsenella uli]MBS6417883.1 ABC transporter ATP-binding protein [Olsenella uli]
MSRTRFLVRILLRNPIPYALAIILALAFAMPLMFDASGMSYNFDSASARETLQILDEGVSSGAYDTAPAELLAYTNKERELLRSVVSAQSDQERLSYFASYYDVQLKEYDAGYLSADRQDMEFLSTYAHLLSSYDGVQVFGSEQEETALYYFVDAFSWVPGTLWLVPAIATAALCARAIDKDRLAGRLPLPEWRYFFDAWLASSLVAIMVALISLLPCLVSFALRNGLGSPEYPIALFQGGEIVTTTLGAMALKILVLVAASTLFLSSVSCAALVATRRPVVGAALAGVLALSPMVPDLFGTTSPLAGSIRWLPITYLRISDIVGRPMYAIGHDSMPLERLTIFDALVVLVACTVLISVVVLVVRGAMSRIRVQRTISENAHAAAHAQSGIHAKVAAQHALVADGIAVGYRGRMLFPSVNLVLAEGSSIGIIAPNGCGKTTLMRALVGERICLRRGATTANGISCEDAAFRRMALYVPGEGGMLCEGATVREHLELARSAWQSSLDVDDVARECGISGFLDRRVTKLSQGMCQQVTIAMARMAQVRYLLLDEPMNALDPQKTFLLSSLIRQLRANGTCIVMSSHLLDNVDELCDQLILFVHEGPVLVRRDNPSHIVFEETYGMREEGQAASAETERS